MFDLLKEGLEEALEFHKGKIKLRTRVVVLPDAPKRYTPKNIKDLRTKLKLTQYELSTWLNVSLNTIQAWEQGTRIPSQASLRLLEMFDKDFSFVKEVLINKKSKGQKKYRGKEPVSNSGTYPKSNIVAKGKF